MAIRFTFWKMVLLAKDSGVLPSGWTFTGDFFKLDRELNIVGVNILPTVVQVQVLPV